MPRLVSPRLPVQGWLHQAWIYEDFVPGWSPSPGWLHRRWPGLLQRSLYDRRDLRLLTGQQRPKPGDSGLVRESRMCGMAYPRSCVYELEKPMVQAQLFSRCALFAVLGWVKQNLFRLVSRGFPPDFSPQVCTTWGFLRAGLPGWYHQAFLYKAGYTRPGSTRTLPRTGLQALAGYIRPQQAG